MNAIPPKDQMGAKTRADAAEPDHVTLTMDYDDEPEAARDRAGAAEAAGPAGAAASSAPSDVPGRKAAREPVPSRLAQVELLLSVELGELRLPLRELLAVEPGQLLALDRLTSEPVTVRVNGRPFARGEIVAIGDRYGVRLLELGGEGEPG